MFPAWARCKTLTSANKNLESEYIVALCDGDSNHASRTIQRYSSAKFHTDYREMLDRQKDIDGLVIATPDHTLAVITIAAIRAGKHVYCQKPLTHHVYEARMLTKASRESRVTMQMGIQGHSGEGIRQTCEWIWSGQLGEVCEVDAWCCLSYYPGAIPGGVRNGPSAPRRRCPCSRGSTGIHGLARPRCGPTTVPITLPPSGASGDLAVA